MHENLLYGIVFFIYLIVYIWVPGYFAYGLLHGKKAKWSYVWLMSFVLGFFLLTIEYALVIVLGIKALIYVFNPVIAIIGGCRQIKSHVSYSDKGNRLLVQMLFMVLIFAVSFIENTLPYGSAYGGSNVYINQDYTWHAGNIVSLSMGVLRPMDIHAYGIKFYYHYFYDLVFAICKYMFGLKAFELFVVGMPIITTLTLGPGIFIVADRLDKSEVKANGLKYLVYCLLPFVGLIANHGFFFHDGQYYSMMTECAVGNLNAAGIATAIGILIIEFFIGEWDSKLDYRNAVLAVVLMWICAGMKGPVAALILLALVCCFLVQGIIERKFVLVRLVYLITSLIAFVGCYYLILADKSGSFNNRSIELFSSEQIMSSAASEWAYLLGAKTGTPVGYIFLALAYIVLISGPVIVLFLIFFVQRLISLIKTKSVGDMYDWMILASSFVGLIACAVSWAPGFSNNYFFFAVIPWIIYSAVRVGQEARRRTITCLLVLICAVGTLLEFTYQIDMAQSSVQISRENHLDYSLDYERVSKSVMDAYQWVRENTDENALVATDRIWVVPSDEITEYAQGRYFYGTAFMERQVYIEGTYYSNIEDSYPLREINESFYSDDLEYAQAQLEEYGIDYLIVTTQCHEGYVPSNTYAEVVFENSEIAVYRII